MGRLMRIRGDFVQATGETGLTMTYARARKCFRIGMGFMLISGVWFAVSFLLYFLRCIERALFPETTAALFITGLALVIANGIAMVLKENE